MKVAETVNRVSFPVLTWAYDNKLEYCIQVWSPYLKQDMEKLEKVQRRATKMIQGYKDLSYNNTRNG